MAATMSLPNTTTETMMTFEGDPPDKIYRSFSPEPK